MLVLDAIYLLTVFCAMPWLVWRRWRLGKHRRGWRAKLFGLVRPEPAGHGPLVWLHAVSVGELNLLPPLIRELSERCPGVRFRITTSTESGFDQAVRLFGAAHCDFFPLDFSWAIRRALRRIRPDLLILMELELWPNLLKVCRQQGLPVMVANARMSDRSFARYRKVSWLASKLLGKLSVVGTQNERYARRFAALGVQPHRIVTTGNLKFDGANRDRESPAILALRKQMNWSREEPVFVAGSTQPGEDLMALEAWLETRKRHPQLRLAVVPRHPHTADAFCRELESRAIPCLRRSQESRSPASAQEVIVVDVIGELPAWWGLATVGFVGGSFGKRGGQSMIEPAALGVPVCFGPHTWNFRDVVELLVSRELAQVIQSPAELQAFLEHHLKPELRGRQGNLTSLIDGGVTLTGAARKTVDCILQVSDRFGRLLRKPLESKNLAG